MRSGEVIIAEASALIRTSLLVNAGLKPESLIPVDEFRNDAGEIEVQAGDFITVAIDSLKRLWRNQVVAR